MTTQHEIRAAAHEAAKAAREPAGEKIMKGVHRLREQYDSDSALARATNISQPTINKILSGKQEPRLDAVGKLMDAAGAKVTFPWEVRDETRKISLVGSDARAEMYRAVDRYTLGQMSVPCPVEEPGAVLPLAKLRELSSTLSLGVITVPEGMLDMAPVACPGDDVVVDFHARPEEGEAEPGVYLVRLPDGSAVCKKVASEGRAYHLYDISGRSKPLSLIEGRDCDKIENTIIGKVVYVMGGMSGRV